MIKIQENNQKPVSLIKIVDHPNTVSQFALQISPMVEPKDIKQNKTKQWSSLLWKRRTADSSPQHTGYYGTWKAAESIYLSCVSIIWLHSIIYWERKTMKTLPYQIQFNGKLRLIFVICHLTMLSAVSFLLRAAPLQQTQEGRLGSTHFF